jgi:hypothetical protein
VTQTPDEKAAAVRSLLPMLTAHLDAHPGYRIVPRAQWVSEPGPATIPTPACDDRCVGCVERCSDEPWAQEYRRLRRAYPVIRRLERLLELQIQYVPDGHRWKAAISGIYLTPWDIMSHGEWPALAEAGVRWLAEQCGGEVPTYQPQEDRWARERRKRQETAEVVERLAGEGLSQRAIARRTGYSQPQVCRILSTQKATEGDGSCLSQHGK